MRPHTHRFTWQYVLIAASFFISGCVSLSDYADPQTTGKVPVQAKNWGAGCVGNGARLTLGGKTNQPGAFIVVAGDKPIFTEIVSVSDTVWVEVDHPLFGDCQIHVMVNGVVVDHAVSKVGAYRAYFVPAPTGT